MLCYGDMSPKLSGGKFQMPINNPLAYTSLDEYIVP